MRDDYDVLVGVNRITVLPTGWVHGQDNEKLVLDAAGAPATWLAREPGVDRYQRLVDFDFSAGDSYWQRTTAFWREVRRFWSQLEDERMPVVIDKNSEGTPRFAPLFEYAARLADGEPYDAEAARAFIVKTLAAYVQRPDPS